MGVGAGGGEGVWIGGVMARLDGVVAEVAASEMEMIGGEVAEGEVMEVTAGEDGEIREPSGLTLELSAGSPQSPQSPTSSAGVKRGLGGRGGRLASEGENSSSTARDPQHSFGSGTRITSNGFPSRSNFRTVIADSFFTRQRLI